MRVHHLNCGTMRPPGGRLVDGGPGVFRRAEVVCHCLLVETGTGLVLIDTGFGTPADDRPAQWLGRGLHAGDVYFHPGEIDTRPHCPPALTVFESILQVDKRARVRNQQRLRELARAHSGQVQIFSAHNAAEYHSYTTTPHPADTARTTN